MKRIEVKWNENQNTQKSHTNHFILGSKVVKLMVKTMKFDYGSAKT